MDQQQLAAVDQWMGRHLLPEADSVLDAVGRAAAAAGLPAIEVSPLFAAFLATMVRATAARHVLEIGTLAGFSTIAMARALPAGGRLVSIEADPRHAEVARANFARAGVTAAVDLRVGAALDVLPLLADERARAGHPAFDMAFLDADKENNAAYADWAAGLLRPGGLMIVDNVVRKGAVIDEASTDSRVQGTRSLFDAMRMDERFSATALQTVGVKGWDGFLIATRR